MKIVFLNPDATLVDMVIENAEEIVVDGNNIQWNTGRSIGVSTLFYIVDDDYQVNVGDPADQSLALQQVKENKINELGKKCNEKILAGFIAPTNNHEYGFDYEDQINFTQQMLLMVYDPTITSVDWKTKDAGVITHTREEFLSVCRDSEHHKRSNIQKFWNYKNQVLSCSTVDEVNSIQWN